MKERPILFSAPMVRALINGSKTQTRRALKVQPPSNFMSGDVAAITDGERWAISNTGWSGGERGAWPPDPQTGILCPYGKVGDQLWVREKFQPAWAEEFDFDSELLPDYKTGFGYEISYPATDKIIEWIDADDNITSRCKPSIHMPRWASRIQLEITGVRVERLNDISDKDALAEGILTKRGFLNEICCYDYRYDEWPTPALFKPKHGFISLWESINGPESWNENPWVWVIEFKVIKISGKSL